MFWSRNNKYIIDTHINETASCSQAGHPTLMLTMELRLGTLSLSILKII
jgi:hypothetical protein